MVTALLCGAIFLSLGQVFAQSVPVAKLSKPVQARLRVLLPAIEEERPSGAPKLVEGKTYWVRLDNTLVVVGALPDSYDFYDLRSKEAKTRMRLIEHQAFEQNGPNSFLLTTQIRYWSESLPNETPHEVEQRVTYLDSERGYAVVRNTLKPDPDTVEKEFSTLPPDCFATLRPPHP